VFRNPIPISVRLHLGIGLLLMDGYRNEYLNSKAGRLEFGEAE
jgi:hypothetical protein